MIETADLNDLNKIVEIGKKCLPIYYDLTNLLYFLTNQNYLILKKIQKNFDNEIVGFLIAKIDKNEKNIHIMSFGICERYRRKGFATEFINYLKSLDNYYSITLYVIDSNIPAQNFYIKNKFKKEKVLKNYYFSLNNADGFQFKFVKNMA